MFFRKKSSKKALPILDVQVSKKTEPTPPPPSPVAYLTQDDLQNAIESVRNRFNLDRYGRDYTSLSISNHQLKLKQQMHRRILIIITVILLVNQFIMLAIIWHLGLSLGQV